MHGMKNIHNTIIFGNFNHFKNMFVNIFDEIKYVEFQIILDSIIIMINGILFSNIIKY